MGLVEEAKAVKRGMSPEEFFNQGMEDPVKLPVGKPGEEPEAEESAPELPPDAPAAEVKAEVGEKKPTSIRIKGKEFDSIEEAIKYAEELEDSVKVNEAYRKGVRDGLTPQEQAQQDVDPMQEILDGLENKLFENPKEAIAKIMEISTQEAIKTIQQQETQRKGWSSFWDSYKKENPDLSSNMDLADDVLKREWSRIKDLPIEKARSEIANITRAKLVAYVEASKPREVLQDGPAITEGSSHGEKSVTAEKKEAVLDFATQLRNLRKRT